jgi:hypothetical protein
LQRQLGRVPRLLTERLLVHLGATHTEQGSITASAVRLRGEILEQFSSIKITVDRILQLHKAPFTTK